MLDTAKTYLLGTPLDDTPIFQRARECSHAVGIAVDERWAHVGALFCDEDGEWQIIDCIGGRGGVVKYPYWRGREEWRGKIDLYAVEYPWFDLVGLHKAIGTPCNPKKLFRYRRLDHHLMPALPDEDGTTCSEVLAMNDHCHISRFSVTPISDIIPLHYQVWALCTGQTIIHVMTK